MYKFRRMLHVIVYLIEENDKLFALIKHAGENNLLTLRTMDAGQINYP